MVYSNKKRLLLLLGLVGLLSFSFINLNEIKISNLKEAQTDLILEELDGGNEKVETPESNGFNYVDIQGTAFDVEIDGNYAYVPCNGYGLAIIDISNPQYPSSPIYQTGTSDSYDVKVIGDWVYVADGTNGLAIINNIDPQNPSSPIHMNTNGQARGLFIEGKYAFVADGSSGLAIINIVNKDNPGTPIYEATSDYAYGVWVEGNYAYVACGTSGLAIIDITDPTNPGVPSYVSITGFAQRVVVEGKFAFVSRSTQGSYVAGLSIVDISNPTSPSLVKEISRPEGYDLKIVNNYAYFSKYNEGVEVLNITYPQNPTSVVNYTLSDNAYGLTVAGTYIYIATGTTGMGIKKIGTIINPRFIGQYTINDVALINVKGNVVYMGAGGYNGNGGIGFYSINITDISSPQLLDTYDTPWWGMEIEVRGKYAYMADSESGLHVFNVQDPSSVIHITDVDLSNSFNLEINGDTLYLSDAQSGIRFFDISNPESPSLLYTYSGYSNWVHAVGDVVFMNDASTNLIILNASNPSNPTLIGSAMVTGDSRRVDVDGEFAYVAAGNGGLQIVNITNQASPSVVGTFSSPNAQHLSISNGIAYLADHTNGLYILNVSDPTSPQQISLDTNFKNSVEAKEDLLFIGTTSGMEIWKIIEYNWEKPIIIETPIESADPVELGGVVNITVTVTALNGVDSVWIEIDVVNNTMVALGNDQWLHAGWIPSSTGVHPYTIWANDSTGNWASYGDSITVEDTSSPFENVSIDYDSQITGTWVAGGGNGMAYYDGNVYCNDATGGQNDIMKYTKGGSYVTEWDVAPYNQVIECDETLVDFI